MPAKASADFVEWGPEENAQKEFELVLSREVSLQSLIDLDPKVPALSEDEPINEYFALRHWLNIAR